MSFQAAHLAFLLALLPAAAHADTLNVYQVNGNFISSNLTTVIGTLSGTLTFDATINSFTSNTLGAYNLDGSVALSFSPVDSPRDLYADTDGTYTLLVLDTNGTNYNPNHSTLYLKLPGLPIPGQALSICTLRTACTPRYPPQDYESYIQSVTNGHYISETGLGSGQLVPIGNVAVTPEPSPLLLVVTGICATCCYVFKRPTARLKN